MEHFRNNGYGWTCKRCSAAQPERAADRGQRARFFSEGEAEEREPRLSDSTRARWRDETRQVLYCPHCGVAEKVQD
jgi:putative hemolysin